MWKARSEERLWEMQGSKPEGGWDRLQVPLGQRTGREEKGMIETWADGWNEWSQKEHDKEEGCLIEGTEEGRKVTERITSCVKLPFLILKWAPQRSTGSQWVKERMEEGEMYVGRGQGWREGMTESTAAMQCMQQEQLAGKCLRVSDVGTLCNASC